LASTDSPPSARARWLLAAGAVAGLAAAAASLLSDERSTPRIAEGAIASVNGTPIRVEEYERLLAALASDRRTPLSDEDRQRVLDRLIEEELLVQHALALGLARSDRRVRADLVSAVLGSLAAASDGYQPDDAEVRTFYEQNRDYFAGPGRLWVRQVFVADEGGGEDAARERAERAAARLRAGEPLERVRAELGSPEVAPIPDVLLPPAKLREYLGPTALLTALDLERGKVSDPVRSAQGHHVLVLVEREPGGAPPLEESVPQVRAELRRRQGDRMLRERLDQLRGEADVTVALPAP
jgi:parvulin-like peptidyl-prolyl isomerase